MHNCSKINKTVSISKALCLVLMVLAHTWVTDCMPHRFIYCFHMPLFFLMSGYCFNERYLMDAKTFIVRKLKGIYLPFIAFSFGFLILHNVFCRMHIYGDLYKVKDFLLSAMHIVTRMQYDGNLLGTFWFLKELLLGNLIFYAFLRLWKQRIVFVILSCFAVAEICYILQVGVPYFGIGHDSFYAATFIAIGYAGTKINISFTAWWQWLISLIIVVASTLWLPNVGFLEQTAFGAFLFLFPAVAGTLLVFNGIDWLRKRTQYEFPVLMTMGKYPYAIIALHFLSFKIVSYIIIYYYHLPIDKLQDFPVMLDYSMCGWWVGYFIVGIGIPLLLALCCHFQNEKKNLSL